MMSKFIRRAAMGVFVFLCAVVGFSCGKQAPADHSNRVSFEIHPQYGTLFLPVAINDSVTAKMAFDTGAVLGSFDLDSTFCASNPTPLWEDGNIITLTPNNGGGGSAWVSQRPIGNRYWHETDFAVKFGETEVNYDSFMVWDRIGYYGHSDYDGLFNIPATDTTHVWELNFEHNYLEVHDLATFTMPDDCLIAAIRQDEPDINITLPMKITTYDGDTLIFTRDYLVDTGASWDIYITPPAEELDFFKGKEFIPFRVGETRADRYITTAEILDGFKLDDLRIYAMHDAALLPTTYILGLNFLKRFNVFIDLKNGIVGLQPLKEFHRKVGPWRWYNLDLERTERGSYVITGAVEHKKNYYLAAGMKVGDEIVGVNGVALTAEMPWEEEAPLWETERLEFDVLRSGEQIRITVELDPEEKLGE